MPKAARSTARIVNNDTRLKEFMKRIGKKGPVLDVGVLGEKASGTYEGTGATVGLVAEVHEFGLGVCPERSFIRATIDAEAEQIKAGIRRAALHIVKGRPPGAVMNLLGMWLVGKMQERISSNIPPPVTEATQARKGPGKTTTLINTGELRRSITHRLVSRA